jgi:hypothetical protein
MSAQRGSELKQERKCPFESAHTRLRQAHDLWHQLAASYAVPEDFVRNLNQLIVTLRQVTFMLQRQKEKISDFDTWYEEGWRERMKADPMMAWLHDARTKIEHVGDLDLASTAKVTVVASWLDGPYAEFDVQPHVGPREIAEQFDSDEIPDRLRKEGLLKVERRWVSDDLPEHKLTDVCAHGYGVLATILSEAHEHLGIQMRTFGAESHEGRHDRMAHLGGRLPCMLLTREERTAHLHFAKGDLVELEQVDVDVEFTPQRMDFFKRRSEEMLVDPETALRFKPDEDPLDIGGKLSRLACRTLVHDGYHDPLTFFLDSANNLIGITKLNFEDQAEKYLAFRGMADEAEKCGADTVIHVGEVWEAKIKKESISTSMPRASERPDRTEALCVMVATSDGRERVYGTPFTRNSKNWPVVGETEVQEGGNRINASFLPLRKMWLQGERSAASR